MVRIDEQESNRSIAVAIRHLDGKPDMCVDATLQLGRTNGLMELRQGGAAVFGGAGVRGTALLARGERVHREYVTPAAGLTRGSQVHSSQPDPRAELDRIPLHRAFVSQPHDRQQLLRRHHAVRAGPMDARPEAHQFRGARVIQGQGLQRKAKLTKQPARPQPGQPGPQNTAPRTGGCRFVVTLPDPGHSAETPDAAPGAPGPRTIGRSRESVRTIPGSGWNWPGRERSLRGSQDQNTQSSASTT